MTTQEKERRAHAAARAETPSPAPVAKAPIPAAVAAIIATFRGVFKRVEDQYVLQREGRRVIDTRGWTLEFRVAPDDLDGGFVAECPQLPGAMSQGETEQEALESLADVVEGILYLRVQRRLQDSTLDTSSVASVRVVSIPLP
jgi:predicted RNase H-like HicB family nuclease